MHLIPNLGVAGLADAARLREAGVRLELPVPGTGGHGFGMRVSDPRLPVWPQPAANWLTPGKFLPAGSASVAPR